jgi:phenylalanyl-tRNA synthetase beta chain
LGDDHNGIIVLDNKCRNGSDALIALGADDPVIDIAVNPDRGYAMSVRGAARELAMSLGFTFKDIDSKALIRKLAKIKKPGKVTQAEILDKTGANLIFLRSLSGLDSTAQTPPWMARRLTQAGMRPISLAVDITNYVMLELGQPLHAFDAEKISGKLRVQRAGKFKTITTLDNQVRKLAKDDLLIADEKRPLALAGTMGGLDSEVGSETTRIALEAAHFIPTAVAQNSRRHILSSEASRRFERGVDPLLAEVASARAALLLVEFGGAKYHGTSSKGAAPKPITAVIDPSAISRLIGTDYSSAEITKALTSVGCRIAKSGKKWKVTAPSWRSDLGHVSDFSEEVARYFGYDRIPSRIPTSKIPKSGKTGLSALQQRRRILALSLASKGFTEVHNYPFVNQSQMELFGFTGDRAKAFKVANPISDENPLLRTHLSIGLLESAARNLSRGAKSVALFESGLVFRDIKKLENVTGVSTDKRPSSVQIKKIYESVPYQTLHIGGVVCGEIELSGWWGKGRSASWQDAIAITSELIGEITDEFEVKNVELAPWHPGRCAEFTVAGMPIAHAGEIHPRVTTALGLPERSIFFALVVDAIPIQGSVRANPVITMPAAIQDISIYVPASISAAEVTAALREGAGELCESILLFDRFQREGEDQVSLAFTMTFRAADRTLTSDEVSKLRERAGDEVVRRLKATIRS